MENQPSSAEHTPAQPEGLGNAFGEHPLAQGGFAGSGEAPSLPPPDFSMFGGASRARRRKVRNQPPETQNRAQEASGGAENDAGSTPPRRQHPGSPANSQDEGSGSWNEAGEFIPDPPSGGGNRGNNVRNNPPPPDTEAGYSEGGDYHGSSQPNDRSGQTAYSSASNTGNPQPPTADAVPLSEISEDDFFAGHQIPKKTIRTIGQTFWILNIIKIGQLNQLAANQSHTVSADDKTTESEAAAVAPEGETESREARMVVNSLHEEEETQVDTSSSKTNYKNELNSAPTDPGKLRNYINQGKMEPLKRKATSDVYSGQTETESTYGAISNLPGTLQDLDHDDLPTQHEAALPTDPLKLGQNLLNAPDEAHTDFSGIMDALNEQLHGSEVMEGEMTLEEALESDTSAFALHAGEQYQALKEGIETNNLDGISSKVEEVSGPMVTNLDTAESTRKGTMESYRTPNLDESRRKQVKGKETFETAREALAKKLNGHYLFAKGKVEGMLTDLRGWLDGTKIKAGDAGLSVPDYLAGETGTHGLQTAHGLENELNLAVELFYADSDYEYDKLLDSSVDGGAGGAWDYSPSANDYAYAPFRTRVDAIIDKYSGYIDSTVEDCHKAIDDAQLLIERDYNAHVEANGPLSTEVKESIMPPLGQLRSDVNDERNRLEQDMAQEKKGAIDEVQEYIDSFKNPLKILAMQLLNILLEAGEAALRFLLRMFGVSNPDAFIAELVRIAGIIGDILKDPIGFARYFVLTIEAAFKDYFNNIDQYIQEIVMGWFFGQPDLEFPSDFKPESWLNFIMQQLLADGNSGDGGLSAEGVAGYLDAGLALPGGMVLDLNVLVTEGPAGLWESMKGQLVNLTPIPTEVSGPGTGNEGTEGAEEVEMATSPEEILAEVSSMDWETLLQEADGLLGTDITGDLDNARYIFDQLVAGNIPGLIDDLKQHVEADVLDIQTWLRDGLIDWVVQDLVPKLLEKVATIFVPGGNLKTAIKVIFDGVMWIIENREQIWSVIETIFGTLPMIAAGNVDGAKANIISGFNAAATLVLDFLTTVGLNASPSSQFGKMIDKLKDKVGKGFDGLMKKIQDAVERFVEQMQKVLGQPKKKKNRKPGTEEEAEREKDYKGENIPSEDRIGGKINDLKGRIDTRIDTELDEHGTGQFTPPNYGSSYANRVKTYQVMQGLLELYKKYGDAAQTEEERRQGAQTLANQIRTTHKVFRTITVVEGEGARKPTYEVPEGVAHWSWEWTASEPKSAAGDISLTSGDDELFNRWYTDKGGNSLAVQLFLGAGSTIDEIQIAGRPARTFSDSMGDHTTAFIVHVEGIKQKLLTKTTKAGVDEMVALADSLTTLPGYQLVGNLTGKHKTRFDKAYGELEKLKAVKTADDNVNEQTAHLQAMIRLYLEVRELLPLSTFDIRKKSAMGGKGHGESSAVPILRDYGKPNGPGEEDVKLAIQKLFDMNSSAAVLVESNVNLLKQMGPGTVGSNNQPVRGSREMFKQVWSQHLKSIAISFPAVKPIAESEEMVNYFGAMEPANGAGGNETLEEDPILKAYTVDLRWAAHDCHAKLTGDLTSKKNELFSAIAARGLHRGKYDPSIGDKYARMQQFIANMKGETGVVVLRSIFNPIIPDTIALLKKVENLENIVARLVDDELPSLYATDSSGSIPEIELSPYKLGFHKILKRQFEIMEWSIFDHLAGDEMDNSEFSAGIPEAAGARPSRGKSAYNEQKEAYEAEYTMNADAPRKAFKYREPNPNLDAEEIKRQKVATARNNLGIQIELDSSGKITKMISDGRSMSPFKGTMGAHTIAWTMHLNHVRSLIIGKNINAAIGVISGDFYEFVTDLKAEQKGLNTENDPDNVSGALWDRIGDMQKVAKKKKDDAKNLAFLQEFIANLLAYTNFIKDITRESVNVDGKSEGNANRDLQKHEQLMWAKLGAAKSVDESRINQTLTDYYSKPGNNLDQDADELVRYVRLLQDRATAKLIVVQYQMLQEAFPWTFYTIKMANKLPPSVAESLKRDSPDDAGSEPDNKRPRTGS
ncbi:MAG: hypothetical protein AAF998_28520 [Bacteroidota bacterium]